MIVVIAVIIAGGLLAAQAFSDDKPTSDPATATPAPQNEEGSLLARRLLAKQLADEQGESGPETASMKARRWLKKNGGIAIIIGDGTTDDATPDELGKKVVQRFWDDYKVKAAYFVRPSTAQINTLTFENRYFPLGRGVVDENGKKTGVYTPSMWRTKELADALITEIYEFHVAALELQVGEEKAED